MSKYDENPFVIEDEGDVKSPLNGTSAGYFPPPYWLNDTPGAKPAANPAASAGDQGAPAPVAEDPSTAIPRLIFYTRVANLILSICMMLTSLLAVLTTQNATTGVLACYVVVFSCLLCCFETHLKQVSKVIALNFGFMYSAKSRAIFMAFIGTILFSFSLFGKIIGLAMLANAGFNMFIVFRYPGYEDAQRKDAQSEIADYLASNPAFAKQMLNAGVSASAEILRNNPELARQGAQAMYTAVANQPPQSAQPRHSSSSSSLDNYATV